MINIYVCEDDTVQRKQIEAYIEDYICSEDGNILLAMKLRISTDNPQEIINDVKASETTGLYFLDIDLNNKMTGMTLAKEIRKYDQKGEIVFITTHSEMMPLTFEYKLKALDYIVKDQALDIEKKIIKCINLANERYLTPQNKPVFYIKSGSRIISEEYENIMYFEKIKGGHRILMHTRNGVREFRGTLKEIDKQDACLCRCNQEIVVNINNIMEFDRKKRVVHMINGSICYSSFRSARMLEDSLDRNNNVMA